jgi:hypothetical protein
VLPGSTGFFRRRADRKVPLNMELSLTDGTAAAGPNGGAASKTFIRVRVLLQRHRDRRHADGLDRARQLLASLKSYLMATEEKPMLGEGDKGEPPSDRHACDR